MPDFSKRSEDIEIMDDLNCAGEVVDQTLRELEKINELLGGNYVTIAALKGLVKYPHSSISIADLGCGSGDMLKRMKRWADKRQIKVHLTGIDANPHIISFAEANTPDSYQIRYEAIDIFSEEFKQRKFDVVTGTLFFHHFSDAQLIRFFRQLKSQVTTGIVVNDIHRHWFSYYSIKLLTKLFSRSAMVKFDAPLSVLRAFKKEELKNILDQAGFTNYKLKWMWAFRWQAVIWIRKM